ncbi:MAG: glycoside hydrolase family 127 protein [Bacteroidales bacterium]|nr:glycoside hydrolase family 127 protein [Bacteroidales bacterium]MCB9028265.1 glycoside hydrolase family 127 protein [Bacteroidales bacterium]
MKEKGRPVILAVAAVIAMASCTHGGGDGNYPIRPVPFTSVKMTDNFWAPRIEKNHEVTIPIAFGYCESTGRVRNFEIAGGLDTGAFQTIYPFDDSDVTKIIEGASYSLQTFPDPELEAYLDTLIYKIGLAQEDDGYLYTNRTIAEMGYGKLHEWAEGERWEKTNILSHELYNLGHMYEAAVAHYQATGKRELLDISLRSADLVDKDFGWDAFASYPGHQVIEMGLVKLYRLTGEKRYLDLAKFFLDARGTRDDGEEYSQSHKKVVDQTEAVGHSVRATYMYSGMADVAAILGDEAYVNAITKIWEDLVHRKMYITGGIGASGGNEGFAEPYHLPNMSAYCETCASIGNIFFNHRLFSMHGEGKYFDVLEKTLYNGALSGVNLAGDRFFYPNPLESNGQHERSAWFGCACCPSNVCRFIPAIPGYIYSVTDKDLYVNLFASNNADIELGNRKVTITQATNYPWEGRVIMTVDPDEAGKFNLRIRIPGWARNEALPGGLYSFSNQSDEMFVITVNGQATEAKIVNGYAIITRKWQTGDRVELELPMPVRTVIADERVKEDEGKMAVQRGPLMFCAEWPDNADDQVLGLVVDEKPEFTTEYRADLLNGTQVIATKARQASRNLDGTVSLGDYHELTLIPYHLWNNRGPGGMKVWLPYRESAARPTPAPTVAYTSVITASTPARSLTAINDQLEPANSNDHTWPYYHWWPKNDGWEWVRFDFAQPATISKVKVYWFDDGPAGGCRIPDEWSVEYMSGGSWKKAATSNPLTIARDAWNIAEFAPVTASAVKINVRLSIDFSSGIHEVVIE